MKLKSISNLKNNSWLKNIWYDFGSIGKYIAEILGPWT